MPDLRVTVLTDNTTFTDRYFSGEPGLSLAIETGGKKLLFDLGYSGVFIENARKMGLGLLDLDAVVLSHGHIDHVGGLSSLLALYFEAEIEQLPHGKPTLIAHPGCFLPRRLGSLPDIGSFVSRDTAGRYFPLQLHRDPFWITDDLVFLGEIQRVHAFEPGGKMEQGTIITPDGDVPDLTPDDSALAYRGDDGLVILTGCSHAGICNIIDHARKVCDEERILDVVGGLHLLNPDPVVLSRTCRFLAEVKPRALHPCHCTDLASKIALSRVVRVWETGVGLRLEY